MAASHGNALLRLTPMQKILVEAVLPEGLPRLRIHDFFTVLEAIFHVVRTGCQWNMLPSEYPPYQTVYQHFRCWSERGWMDLLLQVLVRGARASVGENPEPVVGVLDSESVRSCLPQSQKGVDGHKKVKGIKRTVLADSHGWPLALDVSTANTHDAKGGIPAIATGKALYPSLREIKADKGYSGPLERILPDSLGIYFNCVKSNLGSSDFIPMEGRWVVEALFAWLSKFRRLARNYEKFLRTAREMAVMACVMFMLRFFR